MRYWFAKRFLHWALVLMGDSTARRYLLWTLDNAAKVMEAEAYKDREQWDKPWIPKGLLKWSDE